MKVAVIGATGQLGSDIVKVFSQEPKLTVVPLSHEQIEITKSRAAARVLDALKSEVIITTAAFHKVDDVEKRPQQAFLVNAIASRELARYAQQNGAALMFISTDYVFGADRKRRSPYREDDCPAPVNVYGVSKLAGELLIRASCQKYWIVRTSGLFGRQGASGKGGNFVQTMLRLAETQRQVRVVADQIVSPTYTLDLAKQLLIIVRSGAFGLFHASSQGQCSWYEFAAEIFRLTKKRVDLQPVASAEFPTPAPRPAYCVLENARLKSLGLDHLPHWKVGLRAYLTEKGNR